MKEVIEEWLNKAESGVRGVVLNVLESKTK